MATWIAPSTELPSHASASGFRLPGPRVLLGSALTLAYLPHLIAYSGNLMKREHYQFFPLAWLGAVVLVYLRRDELKSRDGATVPAVGWSGVGLGALLLAVASLLNSSWLAMVSVLPMAMGMAWLAGGWSLVRPLGPALILFATTLRLPGSLDAVLIRDLRALAVGCSSRVLDLIGIVHVPTGNVLRVPGGDLLVDEACSGVNSLVSIMAVVLFLGLLLRRRPLHLVLLLAWSAGIVLLANVARVSIVTIAFSRWQVDLLRGWKHATLGVALYGVSLGLVMSLDQLILLLRSMIPGRSSLPRPSSPRATDSPRVRGGPRPRQLAIVATAIAVIALINPIRWTHGAFATEAGSTEVTAIVERAKLALNERNMPAELDGWRRVGFKTEERKSDNAFGQFSACWQYRLGTRVALVSVDYPFLGWHELLICYDAIDWSTQRRQVVREEADAGSGPSTAFVAATLSHKNGGYGSLRYGLVDDLGHGIEPAPEGGLGIEGRELAWGAVPLRPTYQFQVFGTGFRPPTAEEQQQYTSLYQAANRELQRRLSESGAIRP